MSIQIQVATIDQIATPIRIKIPGANVGQADSLVHLITMGIMYFGDRSHYSYVIVDPTTKKPVGDIQNSSLTFWSIYPWLEMADGYMYATSSNKLTAVKNEKCNISDRKILPTLMNWGVGVSNDSS